jgi:hypothetical protein
VCGSSARTDLCGGRSAMIVPTATELHAVFLKENRTRGTGWGCVQEIRVSRSFFARCGIPLHSDRYPCRFKRATNGRPHISRKTSEIWGTRVGGRQNEGCLLR